MYDISKLPNAIDIGYVGENAFRSVEVDMTAWEEQLPGGTPAAICQLPGSDDPYRPTVVYEDNILKLVITESDLGEIEGEGFIQFEMKKGSIVAKSPIIRTMIHQAIRGEDDV